MDFIQDWIAEGEHQQQDFKFCISDSKKIARSLAAFANTDGGRLLIGVKDNGKIAGIRSDEEFYMIEAASKLYTKPVVPIEINVWEVSKKTILEVKVEPSKNRPHKAPNENGDYMMYIRKKDENILGNRIISRVWKYRGIKFTSQTKFTEKERLLLQKLNELGEFSLNKFLKLAELPKFKGEQLLVQLISWNIIEMIHSQNKWLYRLSET